MARIADFTEQHETIRTPVKVAGRSSPSTRALAHVAHTVADEVEAKLIVAFTESGATAEQVSSYQPHVPHSRDHAARVDLPPAGALVGRVAAHDPGNRPRPTT